MASSALHLAVSKHLREITLDVDLSFEPGVTVVAGPSGAGKSTLLRLVAGLISPDAGTIRLGGRILHDADHGLSIPSYQRDISLVFQDYALFPHLSVRENVAYGLVARHVRRAERQQRVAAMLERLGIASLAHARPPLLSGGQRQRVALARALVLEPRALLLDEPLAALDIQTRASVRAELRDVLADLAIPTVLVTHDYADALVFGDRIVILVDGRVAQDGSHSDLLAHPRTRFVADFTGVNFFEGRLQAHAPDRLGRVLVSGGLEIFVPAEGYSPGPVTLGLRPWEITLSTAPPAGSARNVLRGRVLEVLPLGGRVRVTLAVGPEDGACLVAEVSPEAQTSLDCRVGQILYASFKAMAVSLGPG